MKALTTFDQRKKGKDVRALHITAFRCVENFKHVVTISHENCCVFFYGFHQTKFTQVPMAQLKEIPQKKIVHDGNAKKKKKRQMKTENTPNCLIFAKMAKAN